MFSEFDLYLYKSITAPSIKYCCHVWVGAPSYYLDMLDKLEKQVCRTVGLKLAASLEPLGHCRNIAFLTFFFRYYFGGCSSELIELVPLVPRYSDRLHDFSVTVLRCYKDVSLNSFFPCTCTLWNSLLAECFPLTYDLISFKSRVNRHFLSYCSF